MDSPAVSTGMCSNLGTQRERNAHLRSIGLFVCCGGSGTQRGRSAHLISVGLFVYCGEWGM